MALHYQSTLQRLPALKQGLDAMVAASNRLTTAAPSTIFGLCVVDSEFTAHFSFFILISVLISFTANRAEETQVNHHVLAACAKPY